MEPLVIACDLGTGGCKSSLYQSDGVCLASHFTAYPTLYPAPGWHEQRPEDWWQAVVESIRRLLEDRASSRVAVRAIGISGHSLGVVPLDTHGALLRETTPIWSDSRAGEQAARFFTNVDEAAWYRTTGNGFPPPLYSIFKILWYRDREPEMFAKTDRIVGTKDYVNHRLTGVLATDYSYASGSGVYDLKAWRYAPALVEAAGIPPTLLPQPVDSSRVLGTLTPDAARLLGLPEDVQVVAGGVDNSCMALGARNIEEGRVYNSLGSSSWIAVSSAQPLLDDEARPYVFTHVIPGLFTSALAIFSAGTSFRWLRDNVLPDVAVAAEADDRDPYDALTALAAESPPGANGLLFNPSLAGGTSLDANPDVRGAFAGIDLSHNRADLARAAMEGIALGLGSVLKRLRRLTTLSDEMLVVGGASRSSLWRSIFADVYGMRVVKTSVDQQAAALGAAALAAVGAGLWEDFSPIDRIHEIEEIAEPDAVRHAFYQRRLRLHEKLSGCLAELADLQRNIDGESPEAS